MPTGGSPQRSQGSEGTGTNVLSAIGESVGNVGEKIKKPFENITGKGSGAVTTNIGETLGNAAQSMKKPMENITEGGREVFGAVGETVGDIGDTMIKPGEKVQEHGQEGQGGDVLDAIGETIVEIAQTTRNMVAGEGLGESREGIGSQSQSTEHGKHEEGSLKVGHRKTTQKTSQAPQRVGGPVFESK